MTKIQKLINSCLIFVVFNLPAGEAAGGIKVTSESGSNMSDGSREESHTMEDTNPTFQTVSADTKESEKKVFFYSFLQNRDNKYYSNTCYL